MLLHFQITAPDDLATVDDSASRTFRNCGRMPQFLSALGRGGLPRFVPEAAIHNAPWHYMVLGLAFLSGGAT